MLFKSQVYTQASGSIGGVTYSRNRGGMYTRSRAVPTNPNSIRQQSVRSALTTLVNYWTNTLTNAERAAWADYAAQVAVTNRLGDATFLTGQQHFIRANTPREVASLSMVTTAPTTFDTGAPVSSIRTSTNEVANSIGFDGSGAAMLTTALVNGGASAAGTLIMQIGPTVNETINYYKGPYQFATSVPVALDDDEVDIATAFAGMEQAQPIAVNQFRPVRLRISYDDGRLSAPYAIIAPTVDEGP